MTQIDNAARLQIEILVITRLIEIATSRGFTLHSVSDGEEWHTLNTTQAALSVVFSVDEANIYFTPPGGGKRHMVYVVLGNDGWDVIADASVGAGWDEVLAEHSEWVDATQEDQDRGAYPIKALPHSVAGLAFRTLSRIQAWAPGEAPPSVQIEAQLWGAKLRLSMGGPAGNSLSVQYDDGELVAYPTLAEFALDYKLLGARGVSA